MPQETQKHFLFCILFVFKFHLIFENVKRKCDLLGPWTFSCGGTRCSFGSTLAHVDFRYRRKCCNNFCVVSVLQQLHCLTSYMRGSSKSFLRKFTFFPHHFQIALIFRAKIHPVINNCAFICGPVVSRSACVFRNHAHSLNPWHSENLHI